MSFMELSIQDQRRRGGGKEVSVTQGSGFDKIIQDLERDVFDIQNNVSKYKRLVDKLGTVNDTVDLRAKISVAKSSIQSKLKITKTKLVEKKDLASELEKRHQNRIQKAAQSFSSILDDFQQALKICAEREVSAPPQISTKASILEQDSEKSFETEELLRYHQQEELQRLDNLVLYNEAIIEERDIEIQGLVRDIGELNEMFKDVATLVSDQGKLADDVETNISKTAECVDTAHKELVSAERNQKSATTKKLILFIIIGIVVGIIIAALIISLV